MMPKIVSEPHNPCVL